MAWAKRNYGGMAWQHDQDNGDNQRNDGISEIMTARNARMASKRNGNSGGSVSA
jgi:hypothetical protein